MYISMARRYRSPNENGRTCETAEGTPAAKLPIWPGYLPAIAYPKCLIKFTCRQHKTTNKFIAPTILISGTVFHKKVV